MNKIFRVIAGSFITVLFVSCQNYEPLAFKPDDILEELEEERKLLEEKYELSIAHAEKLMSQRNRKLKKLHLEYEKLQKIAEIKTPLPNPTLEFGPSFGSRLGETEASSTQPFIGLGFTVPLGPRLARNDDLNKAKEIQAYNNIVIEHRKLFLDLRKVFVHHQISQQKLEILSKLERALELSKKTTEKLIELGTATKLGLSQVKLQLKELRILKIDYLSQLEESKAAFASLLNIPISEVAKFKLMKLKHKGIEVDLNSINEIALSNNFELAAKEMEFHISDYQLKLELAKQYPDLNFGISSENEVGEKKRTVSVPFSIELPVFDRNKHSISEAYSERNNKIESYKQALSQTLTDLEKSFNQYQYSKVKNKLITEEIIPLAKETTSDAEKSLKFGSIDVLRYLDLVIQNKKYQLEAISIKEELWEKAFSLEKSAGYPFFQMALPQKPNLKKSFKSMVE